MAKTKITAAQKKKYSPNWKPTELTLAFEDGTFTANWKVPGEAQDSTKYPNKVFTGQTVKWRLDVSDLSKKNDPVDGETIVSGSSGTDTHSYAGWKGKWKGKRGGQAWDYNGKALHRHAFHPYTSGKIIDKAVVTVKGFHDVPNDKKSNGKDYVHGSAHGHRFPGPTSGAAQFAFKKPAKPTVEYEFENNNLTVTVKQDISDPHQEWVRTVMHRRVKGSGGNEIKLDDVTTDQTEYTSVIDMSTYTHGLTTGQSVVFKLNAVAQGVGGDESSGWQTYEIALPDAAVIEKVACTEKAVTGKIRVYVKSVGAYTEEVQLQRRHGEDGSWEDVEGGVDYKQPGVYEPMICSSLYDSVGAAAPVDGEKIYYRIKSTRHNFATYSEAVWADCLFTEAPRTDCAAAIGIIAVTPNISGTFASVVVGYMDITENAGLQLLWSESRDALDSTEPPSTADFADSVQQAPGVAMRRTLNLGISAGKTYYIWARRYREVDSETKYSAYSGAYVLKTNDATDDTCAVALSLTDDGMGIEAVIGIDENNENTGTEITWSDFENAWMSNRTPNELLATWACDSTSRMTGFSKSQTAYLSNLEAGKTYYVKARRYLDPQDGDRSYGDYSKTQVIAIPDVDDTTTLACGIVSAEPNDDGTSVTVVLGWNGDRTGCEVTWSDDSHAWESTDEPQAHEFETVDSENMSGRYFKTSDTALVTGKTYYTVSNSVYTAVSQPNVSNIANYYEYGYAWSNTSTVRVRGLEQGTTYYFRGRSYFDRDDGERAWSPYTNDLNATPYAAPEEVVLTGPDAVERGESIELYWTISGELEQTEWDVHKSGEPGRALATGTGSACHAYVEPERYGSASSITLYVDAGCGGALRQSNSITVGIADKPKCEVCAPVTATAQPLSVEVYTDDRTSSILMTLFSDGVTLAMPDGDRDQLYGDTIWTDDMTPSWTSSLWTNTALYTRLSAESTAATSRYNAAVTAKAATQAALDALTPQSEGYAEAYAANEEAAAAVANTLTAKNNAAAALTAHSSGNTYKATVSLPTGLALVDGGKYRVSARTVEPVAGLTSEPAVSSLSVAWSHQAPVPSSSITVTPDEDDRTATIELAQPSGYVEGDVYDIYRKNANTYELIASDVPVTATVVDRHAPFGSNADLDYVVACRTPDGDVELATYEYELPVDLLRFDWANTFVELPWNVEAGDAYEKSFEARGHVDGSVGGYFDKAVTKTASYQSDINRAEGYGEVNLVRELAEYPGAVFCRTHMGTAFQCDAEVSGIDVRYNTATVPVKLSMTAMDLTSQFMVAPSDITEEE